MTDPATPPQSPWVARFAPLVAKGGTVLDLACGGGRHTRLFRAAGHPVVALDADISRIRALEPDPGIEIIAAELEGGAPWPLEGRKFAAIIVANYLHRPLFPRIIGALDDGGVLIYETFGRGNERFGRPRNPDFLLMPGELLQAVEGRLQVIAYEHGEVTQPRPAVVQRICAVKCDDLSVIQAVGKGPVS
ncbi:MAG: class I SAM-dependent methyltransferase [Alphaproteobacteria bacterium]